MSLRRFLVFSVVFDVYKFLRVQQLAKRVRQKVINLSFGLILWRIAADFETNFAHFGTFNSWKHLWTCQNVRNFSERCGKSLWKQPKTQVIIPCLCICIKFYVHKFKKLLPGTAECIQKLYSKKHLIRHNNSWLTPNCWDFDPVFFWRSYDTPFLE